VDEVAKTVGIEVNGERLVKRLAAKRKLSQIGCHEVAANLMLG